MIKRLNEIIIILVLLATALIIAYFANPCMEQDHQDINRNFAQILAEILAVIFVLPQVIIQLTVQPQNKDIKAIFSGTIPGYFLYYIITIVLLATEILYSISLSVKNANILSLASFLGALFLIFPYLYFLIKEYSISENLNKMKRKILKNVKKLCQETKEEQDEKEILKEKNMINGNEKNIGNLKYDLISSLDELKENILILGNKDNKIFYSGLSTLVYLIKVLYEKNNKILDDMLIRVIENISEIGEKIDNDGSISMINYRLYKEVNRIVGDNTSEFRVNLFTLRIILTMEKVVTQTAVICSRETIRNTIFSINKISLKGLRAKPPVRLEYHLIAESLKKIGLLSLENNYENCVNDVIENLDYMSKLSIRSLPAESLPVYKICDVLSEIGIKASSMKNEVFCIQCMNVTASIIQDLIGRKITEDIDYCITSLFELASNIWNNFEELEGWLCERIQQLMDQTALDFHEYIEPVEEILKSKSIIAKAIFTDFISVFENEFGED